MTKPSTCESSDRRCNFFRHPVTSAAKFVLACALLTHLVAARGQVHAETVYDVNAPVQAGSKITYRKLVDAVFKGVKATESGDLVTTDEKVLRQIGSKERTVLPAAALLTDIKVLRVRGDGKRYIVLAIKAEANVGWGGAFVLADFPEGSAEPQDMADLQGDRFCSLDEKGVALGPDDGFFIENTHSNSGQAYNITDLYHIHGGRLRQIDSIFTLTNRGMCEDSEESLVWKTEADSESPYPKIVATVTLIKKPSEDRAPECPKRKPPTTEVYSETYRWDKAADRYSGVGTGLEKLKKYNEQNL